MRRPLAAAENVVKLAQIAEDAAQRASRAADSAAKSAADTAEHAQTASKYESNSSEAVKFAEDAQHAAQAAIDVAPPAAQVRRQRRVTEVAVPEADHAGKAAAVAAAAAATATTAASVAHDAVVRLNDADRTVGPDAITEIRTVVRGAVRETAAATSRAFSAATRAKRAATVADRALHPTVREAAAAAAEARRHADAAAAANKSAVEAASGAATGAVAAEASDVSAKAAVGAATTAREAATAAGIAAAKARQAAEAVPYPSRDEAAATAATAAAIADEAAMAAGVDAAAAKQAAEAAQYPSPNRTAEAAQGAATSAEAAAAVAEAAAQRARQANETAQSAERASRAANEAAAKANEAAAKSLGSFNEALDAAHSVSACHLDIPLAETIRSIMERLGGIARRFPRFPSAVDVPDFVVEPDAITHFGNELEALNSDVAMIRSAFQLSYPVALSVHSLPEDAVLIADLNDELADTLRIVAADVEASVVGLEIFGNVLRPQLRELPYSSPLKYGLMALLDTVGAQSSRQTKHAAEIALLLDKTSQYKESLWRYHEDLLGVQNCVMEGGHRTRTPLPTSLISEHGKMRISHDHFEELWNDALTEDQDDDRFRDLHGLAVELVSSIDNFTILLDEAIDQIRDNLKQHVARQPSIPNEFDRYWSLSVTQTYADDRSRIQGLREEWTAILSDLMNRTNDLDRYLKAVDTVNEYVATLPVIDGSAASGAAMDDSRIVSCSRPRVEFFEFRSVIGRKIDSIEVHFRDVIDRDWMSDFDEDMDTVEEIKNILDEQIVQFVLDFREQQIAQEVELILEVYRSFFEFSTRLASVVSAPLGDAYVTLNDVISVYHTASEEISNERLKLRIKDKGLGAVKTRDYFARHGHALSMHLGSTASTIDSLERYRRDLKDVENCAIGEEGARIRRQATAGLLEEGDGLDKIHDAYYSDLLRDGGRLSTMIDAFTATIASHMEDVDGRYQRFLDNRTSLEPRWDDSIAQLYESDLRYLESLRTAWGQRAIRMRRMVCQIAIGTLDPDDERVISCQEYAQQTVAARDRAARKRLPVIRGLR